MTDTKQVNRLVVIEQVHYQGEGQEPTTTTNRFYRNLTTDEQPYGPRLVRVDAEWQTLDVGWFKDRCGMMVLENKGDQHIVLGIKCFYPEGRMDALCELPSVIEPFGTIPPGESARWQPLELHKLRVKSLLKDPARLAITLYPM